MVEITATEQNTEKRMERNELIAWWEFPCMLFVVFPLLLLIFYLSLIFVSLIIMCLGVFLLGFILPRTLCASWIWLTISFPMFGKFSTIMSSNIFSGPFSLPSPPPPQSVPASESFQTTQLFTSGGESTGVSASTSVFPMNTQDWSPLGWTGWIPLLSNRLSRVFSNTTVEKH